MSAPVSAASLFDKLREALTSVLGSAATAAIIRRAVKRAQASAPELTGLAGVRVIREGFNYSYELPASWHEEGSEEALRAFRHLADEHVRSIVVELTGAVGTRLLDRIPELDGHGIAAGAPQPR